ncbi:MAG: CHAT domain-containing protein [Acidobacteriota bacterium]
MENQARLETVQGRFGAARRLLEQATFHAGRAGSPRDALIEPRLQTAWLDLLEGRPEDARTILDGLAEQTAGRVDRVALTILDRLGTTLEALDEIGASWVAYRQAEAVARSLDYARGLGAVASNLCRLSVLYPGVTVDGPEAICREAVRTMRAVGDSNRLPTALYGRGREPETLGALDDATALYDEAARHLDRLTAHAVGLEGRTRFAEARSDPLQRLIDLSMRRHWNDPTAGHDRRAFLASERLRARGVLWRLLGSDVAADPTALATPAARGRYQRLVERLTALEASRRQPDAPAEAIGERIATTLDALDVAEQDLRESSPAYEELRPPERSLEAYQAALDDRTAVLATLTGESDSTLWVLTATTWTTYRLAPKHRLEGRARLLRKALARPPDPYATWSVGSRLATDLFGDDLERLTPLAGLRLAYIGDGALQQLPLSVLPIGRTEDGRRRYVVDEHEVIHLPSLNTLLAMRRLDRAPPTRSIALFADPIYRLDPRLDLVELDAAALRELFGDDRPAGRYGRLPFADREADWIAEAFPVTSRQIYRALDASRVHALDPGLADFGIIHFATHGELDSDRPELAALLLSEVADDGRRIPGRLLAQDLAGLDWRAELVVASACETGIDDTFRFEGVGGLARAMFQAGTPRTIASLWKVPSEPTAHLMDAFYDALDAGAAPGEALRAARLHLLRPVGDDRRGAWTAPHVWGGFILVGDWRAFELPD